MVLHTMACNGHPYIHRNGLANLLKNNIPEWI